MQINITVLSVQISTVPTQKGSYQVADVAFKNNSFGGKIEGKKCMSFGATEPAFKVLAENPVGVTFDVEYIQTQGKDGKTYNNWVSMQKAGAAVAGNNGNGAAMQQGAAPGVLRGGATSPTSTPVRSTYETPEERAQRQVFIVRQSSLSSAVATLAVGSKAVKGTDVVSLAKEYEAYVFAKEALGGASGFDDVPDLDNPVLFEGQPNIV